MNPAGLLLAVLALAPALAPAATITIVNLDLPGEGLNDETVVDADEPDGFPPGTTRGAKRMAVLQAAAAEWGRKLQSNVAIRVGASFDPLDCSGTQAVLGKAGPTAAAYGFTNAPKPNTDYAIATAEAIANRVLLPPSQVHILARFNSAVDNYCFGGGRWWYGTTHLPTRPGDFVELYPVAMHELAHGLGFLSFACVNSGPNGAPAACGATPPGGYASGRVDAWSHRQRDLTTGLTWNQLTDAQRAASMVNSGLVWDGPSVDLGLNLWAPTGYGILGGHMALWSPPTVDPGSSVSHWTTAAFLLMRPVLSNLIITQTDLTDCAFRDIGWTVTTTNCSLGMNQPPTISAPATITVTEGERHRRLYGIHIGDPDSAGANIRATFSLSGSDSILSFSTYWGTGDGQVGPNQYMVLGPVDRINSALAAGSLRWNAYDEDATVTNELLITVDDEGHHGSGGPRTATASVTIIVDPVNDPPRFSNSSDASGTVHEGFSTTLGIGQLIDDSGPNPIRLTTTGTCGGLQATSSDGVTVSGTEYERVLEGTVSDLSGYVTAGKLKFFAGDDADAECYHTLTLEDLGHTGAGGPLTATKGYRAGVYRWNDPPAISAPDVHDFRPGGTMPITGIVLSDPDARDGLVRFTIEVDGGWFIPGIGGNVAINGVNSSRMELTGTIANINAFIANHNLSYFMPVPTLRHANATLRIDDQGHTGQPGYLVTTRPLTLFAYTIFKADFE